MLKAKNDLKNLKEKIYIKQKEFMKYMYDNNISNYNDKSIKKNKDEIFLLEFIYDLKKDQYDYDHKFFWNKC